MGNEDIQSEANNQLDLEQKLQASTVISPDFSISGAVTNTTPTLIICGKVLGVAAASLVDKICHNFNDVMGDLIIDLSGCHFFSSVALGFIVAMADQRKKNDGQLILQQANKQIKQVIYMMDMGKFFIFTDSGEETMEYIASHA